MNASDDSWEGGGASAWVRVPRTSRARTRPRATALRVCTAFTHQSLLTLPCSSLRELGGCDGLPARGESNAGARVRAHPRPLLLLLLLAFGY